LGRAVKKRSGGHGWLLREEIRPGKQGRGDLTKREESTSFSAAENPVSKKKMVKGKALFVTPKGKNGREQRGSFSGFSRGKGSQLGNRNPNDDKIRREGKNSTAASAKEDKRKMQVRETSEDIGNQLRPGWSQRRGGGKKILFIRRGLIRGGKPFLKR